jgi:hypothetical protein
MNEAQKKQKKQKKIEHHISRNKKVYEKNEKIN